MQVMKLLQFPRGTSFSRLFSPNIIIGARNSGEHQQQQKCNFSITPVKLMEEEEEEENPFRMRKGPQRWPKQNKEIYPPQKEGEERRPAYVCHVKENVKYSPLKLWYIACFVRGMAIDEALKQLDYIHKKGATIVKEALLEAQELACRQHFVEFKSNLWIADSFSTKGVVIKGMRRHARKRMGEVRYFHSHYFVRLEEGSPPDHYYDPPKDGPTLLKEFIQERRDQRIWHSY